MSRSSCPIGSKCLLGLVESNQRMVVLALVGHLSQPVFPDWRQLITEPPPPCLHHGQNIQEQELYSIFTDKYVCNFLKIFCAPLGVLDTSMCHFSQFLLQVDNFECNILDFRILLILNVILRCQVSILLMPYQRLHRGQKIANIIYFLAWRKNISVPCRQRFGDPSLQHEQFLGFGIKLWSSAV